MTKHFLQRTAAVALLAGIMFQISAPVALAITIPQAENLTGISLNNILAASGLNSEKYSECTSSNVLGQITSTIKNFDKILLTKVGDALKELFNTIKNSLVGCAVAGIVNSLTGGAGIPCRQVVADAASATLKLIKNRELQQNFIARCVARIGLKESVDTITKLMQQQGPYGNGPAWVTDWEQLPKTAEKRAKARFWTILVDTNICPYMKDRIYSYFRVPRDYITNPPSLTGTENVDDNDPFSLRAGCTLPEGFTPENASANAAQYGGYLAVLDLLNQPQNNFQGFTDIAEGQLGGMVQGAVNAATADAISGGGVQSISDCVSWSPDGAVCLAQGPNKQTGGTLRDANAAALQAQLDWLTSTDGTQKKAIDDIRTSIANRLFDLANQPLSLRIELGSEDKPENGFTPSPTPTPVPDSGDANDPSCTGGNPQCVCVKNDPDVQAGVTSVVADAIARAIEVNSELFVNGTSQIAPGVDYRTVLQAICDRMQQPQGIVCKPHPSQDDEIVLVGGPMTISVDVITSDGNVRTNGGRAIAACEPGVQD